MKSDLVIVYHRQPYEEVEVDGKIELRANKSPNGIVPTLKSFFGEVSHGAWIAWKLREYGEMPDWERVVTISDDFGDYTVSRLALTEDQVNSFYAVTSKEALWPILHSFVDAYDYGPVDWPTFQEVNFLFAQAAAEQAADDAIIWIHDYNLWLVPVYLRQMKPNARISFFHHTPFPSPDVFNVLPLAQRDHGQPAALRPGRLPHPALRGELRQRRPHPVRRHHRGGDRGRGRHVAPRHGAVGAHDHHPSEEPRPDRQHRRLPGRHQRQLHRGGGPLGRHRGRSSRRSRKSSAASG